MKEQGDIDCKEDKKQYRSKHTIVIYDVETLTTKKTLPLPENFVVSWLSWGSNERLLSAITRPAIFKKFKINNSSGTNIVSIPIDSPDFIFLFQDSELMRRHNTNISEIENMLRDDPEHILLPVSKGGELDLWKVNIITGKGERVIKGKQWTFAWFTTPDGAPALRFDCRGGRYCPRVEVFAPSENSEDWTLIKTFRKKAFEDKEKYEFWPLSSTDEPGKFYVIADTDSDATASVKIYDTKTQQFTETIIEDPNWDVSGVIVNAGTNSHAGVWYYKNRLTYKMSTTEDQAHIDSLNAYFNDQENVDILSFNRTHGRALAYVSSPNNPGEYYLYDMNTQQVEFLFSSRPQLDQLLYSQTEILKVPTRDGQEITAYLTSPEDGTTKDTPLLVMPHGGPETRDYYDYDSHVQYFVTRGYQVLQVNFRGSSGYGREFAQAGYGEWGGVMQNDLTDAVKYIYDNDRASSDNTCIVGYSYGGYAALYGGATTPKLYKCIVSGGGVSDLLLALDYDRLRYTKKSAPYEYWLESIGHPKDDKDKLEAASPVNLAKEFQAPVLLLHASLDDIVNLEQTQEMEKALKKANKPVEKKLIRAIGHNDWSPENNILYLETIERFLSEHLIGGSPPPAEE